MKVTETPGPSGYFGRHHVQTGRMAKAEYTGHRGSSEIVPATMSNLRSARHLGVRKQTIGTEKSIETGVRFGKEAR
jgi:hypothetical protein